jgi:hypothetical protein
MKVTMKKWHQHPQDCKPGPDEAPLRKGEKYSCPGDPLCDYTELARLFFRAKAIPAMVRLAALTKPVRYCKDQQVLWEEMYFAVCAVHDNEPSEPVEHYHWPDTLVGVADPTDLPDVQDVATLFKYVGPP